MKKSTLLWSLGLLLGAAAATAALAPASADANMRPAAETADAAAPVAPTLVTPANLSVFGSPDSGNPQGVGEIILQYEGATEITLNPGVDVIAYLGNATSPLPRSSSEYIIGKCEASVIEGAVKIEIVGASKSYGKDDNWFIYSAGDNGLTVNVPPGYATIKYADGTVCEAAPVELRYGFDRAKKTNPIGIPDNAELSFDQLAEIVFPSNVMLGRGEAGYNSSVKLARPGETYSSAWVFMTNPYSTELNKNMVFELSRGKDGLVHGVLNCSPKLIPPGEYRIVIGTKYTLMVDGEDQMYQWAFPIKVVELPTVPVEIQPSSEGLLGDHMPKFNITPTDYEYSAIKGINITATIAGKDYNLELAEDGTLSFSAADAAVLEARYMNEPEFEIAVNIPDRSIVLSKDGARSHNESTAATYKARVFQSIEAEQALGTYFVKRLKYTDLRGEEPVAVEESGWDVTVEAAGEMSDGPYACLPVNITNLFNQGEKFMAILNPGTRSLVAVSGTEILNAPGNWCIEGLDGDAIDHFQATINSRFEIDLSNWAVHDFMVNPVTFLMKGADCVLTPKVDNIIPAAPKFSVAFNHETDCIVAMVECPAKGTREGAEVDLPALTAINAKYNDAVTMSRYANPGATIEVPVIEHPAPGTYAISVSASLCGVDGPYADEVVYNYQPYSAEDIAYDYFVFSSAYTHRVATQLMDGSFRPTVFPTSVLKAGNGNLNERTVTLTVGEIVGGKARVTLNNFIGEFCPTGLMDIVTHEIQFNIGDDNEYVSTSLLKDGDEMSYMLVAGNGKDDEIMPATATLDNGVLNFSNWALILPAMDTDISAGGANTVLFTCSDFKAVVNTGAMPAAPELTATFNNNGTTNTVTGTVTLPTTFADGTPLNEFASGFDAVCVYRIDNANSARTELLKSDHLEHGATLTFTDKKVTLEKEYTYYAYAEYLGTANTDEPASVLISTSGIESVIGDVDATITVYDLKGVELLRNAEPAALLSLPAGVYVVNGRTMAIGR